MTTLLQELQERRSMETEFFVIVLFVLLTTVSLVSPADASHGITCITEIQHGQEVHFYNDENNPLGRIHCFDSGVNYCRAIVSKDGREYCFRYCCLTTVVSTTNFQTLKTKVGTAITKTQTSEGTNPWSLPNTEISKSKSSGFPKNISGLSWPFYLVLSLSILFTGVFVILGTKWYKCIRVRNRYQSNMQIILQDLNPHDQPPVLV